MGFTPIYAINSFNLKVLEREFQFQAVIWQSSPIHWTKLIADGARKGNPGETGSGGIIRSHKCDFIFTFAMLLDKCTYIFSEAKAIPLEIQHAKRLGIISLWIESDSAVLINVLNKLSDDPWSIIYTIRVIKSLLRDFQDLCISHICREGNTCADIMANWSITNKASFQFEDLQLLPKEERGMFRLDKFGLPGLM